VLDVLNFKDCLKKFEDCISCSKGWYTYFVSGRSLLQISTPVSLVIFYFGGRAVSSMGLRPLAWWNCGFECRRGHGYLSVVRVVCCQVEVSAPD